MTETNPWAQAPTSSRRRPTHRKGRPTLSRERIAEAAIELIAAEGHHGLTMRTLAVHLGVSARALYNYVADRRDVLGLALHHAQSAWTAPELDPANWERDLRRYCWVMRDWYRSYPGMASAAMSDDFVDYVHPGVMRNNEQLTGLLAALGLSPAQVVAAHSQVSLTVSGFSDWMDRRTANPPSERRQPVSAEVLEYFDDEALPTLRSLSTGTEGVSLDDRFDALLDLIVAGIGAQIPR